MEKVGGGDISLPSNSEKIAKYTDFHGISPFQMNGFILITTVGIFIGTG